MFIYLWAFAIYRIFFWIFPLEAGELAKDSRGEFVAEVNMLFYLLLFNPLILTHFLPAPISRLVYIALGLNIGRDSYSVGVILDPLMTKIGKNSIVGHDALLLSHVIEGKLLALLPITIGDSVTIGTKAIIMPGVTIDDRAVVSAGAIVTKGTHIGPGEIWGGIPAKLLKHVDDV
jgi:acetyltransferase-like isoleucine patch superfamily enzyme